MLLIRIDRLCFSLFLFSLFCFVLFFCLFLFVCLFVCFVLFFASLLAYIICLCRDIQISFISSISSLACTEFYATSAGTDLDSHPLAPLLHPRGRVVVDDGGIDTGSHRRH